MPGLLFLCLFLMYLMLSAPWTELFEFQLVGVLRFKIAECMIVELLALGTL